MKKILISAAIGAVVGYAVRKCQEKEFFERMYRNVNIFGIKIRKELKKNKDITKYETECSQLD